MRIRVIATGGTIDKVYFDAASTYEVGEPQVGPVFRESNVTFDFIVESVVQKDSLAMTDADRALIRQRVAAAPEKLILITHGTDTMTATAAKLEGLKNKVIEFRRRGRHRVRAVGDEDELFRCGRDALPDERAVRVGHGQAVLLHDGFDDEVEGDVRLAEDGPDLGLADLVGAGGVEVDLVNGAAGGDDTDAHAG